MTTEPALGQGPRKQRKPAGWDTGAGGHGSFHRQGRASEIEYTDTDSTTRNKRSVWTIPTSPFPEAHFATFPPKLIEPCILAGTSPQACEHCAAPWECVTERATIERYELDPSDPRYRPRAYVGKQNADRNDDGGCRRFGSSTTLGWQPTCGCADDTGSARCVVLDPFGGAGTTGLVADRLGRDAVLIELNPAYAEMARTRIRSDNPLFTDVA